MRRLLLLLLLFPLTLSAAPEDRPPFFRLDHQGHTAWLLGSIHVGLPDFYPFPAPVEQALSDARVLALEANPSDPQLPGLMQRYGRAEAPLPEELALRVQRHCRSLGIHCDLGASAWLLSAQLALFEMAKAGYQPQMGVESHLLTRLESRPLWELEGMERQLGIFTELSTEAQHQMLEAALAGEDAGALIDAWRAGDHAALDTLMREGLADSPELWQRLMLSRNDQMASVIGDWLGQQDKIFIAVGAGHLVGEEGIPAKLSAAGITVTDCWQASCR
ncbi:TraB/GumN family protein [Ferrimonas balearica]|uniref:TraB/GumN family protein n=1 Tax=Ferrimonas balearica TaxID=44012 RepID=UPI001C9946D1|nr:TraB/GumN family protein [Ferrimonas balearica]MBY5992269.1 TraB/GumN family protein [Ferrimonas balearica]